MRTCAPAYDSLNGAIMYEYLSSWGDCMAYKRCSIYNLQNSFDSGPCEKWLSSKGWYCVCHPLRKIMNFCAWYIHQNDKRIFSTLFCIRMLLLSLWSIRQNCRHNFSFTHSSGPCLQNILHYNVAVHGGEWQYGTQRRDTGIEGEW